MTSSKALDKDLVDEARDATAVHMVAYKQQIKMLYNRHFKFRKFKKGELVLRVAMDARKEVNDRKMIEKWEGPYQIRKVLGKGAHKLQTLDGKKVPTA
ncbi:hypothetical protein WN943_014927 [Citrus x changshan-huyou]